MDSVKFYIGDEDITQFIKPKQVLDFDFSTHVLFRCTTREYALEFQSGRIFFNTPEKWIKDEEVNGKGRGDFLEGTCLSCKKDDNSSFIVEIKDDVNLTYFDYGDYTYFRKKGIENLYCLGFYGLNSNSFNEKIIENDGRVHYVSRIIENYFTSFSKNITKDSYELMDYNKQPVVMFINNPHGLFEKIRDFFRRFGILKQDIIISPVEYLNKNDINLSLLPYPKELLLKDTFFSNQNELRIIINSRNEEMIKYMKEHNNKIEIEGIFDDISILDLYFKDLVVEKAGNNKLLFNLPKSKRIEFENLAFEDLISHLINIINKKMPVFISGENELATDDETEMVIKQIQNVIEQKYKVKVSIEDKEVTITDLLPKEKSLLNIELYDKIQNLEFENRLKVAIKENKFESEIQTYNDKNSIMTKIQKDLFHFYLAEFYKTKNDFNKAIEIYSYCFENDIKKIDSISNRSELYHQIGHFQSSINDLKIVQDLIGYNKDIYTKIGVNLFELNRFEESIIEFNKSIALDENNPHAFFNRSISNYKIGNYSQTKTDALKAIELDPKNEKYCMDYDMYYANL